MDPSLTSLRLLENVVITARTRLSPCPGVTTTDDSRLVGLKDTLHIIDHYGPGKGVLLKLANGTLTLQRTQVLTNADSWATRVEPHSMRCSGGKARPGYAVANAQVARLTTPAAWSRVRLLLLGGSTNRGTLPLLLGASLFTGLFFAVILRLVA